MGPLQLAINIQDRHLSIWSLGLEDSPLFIVYPYVLIRDACLGKDPPNQLTPASHRKVVQFVCWHCLKPVQRYFGGWKEANITLKIQLEGAILVIDNAMMLT